MTTSRWLQFKEATLEEKLTLSPLEKWKKYKIFPWKLFVQVLMSLVVIAEITLRTYTTSQSVMSLNELIDHIVKGEDYDADESLDRSILLHTVSSFTEHISKVSKAYFALPDTIASNISLTVPNKHPRITYIYMPGWNASLTNPTFNTKSKTVTAVVSKDNPHPPFGESGFNDTMGVRQMKSYTYNLPMQITHHAAFNGYQVENWDLKVHYSFNKRSLIEVTTKFTLHIVKMSPVEWAELILGAVLLALSIWSLFLAIKQLITAVMIMKDTKKTYLEFYQKGEIIVPWSKVPFRVKMRFFNTWHMVMLISSIMSFFAGLFDILQAIGLVATSSWIAAIRGLSGFLVMMNYLRFLEFSKKFYMLIYVVKAAVPIIMRLLVTCIPIFVGFVLAGVALFSKADDHFSTIQNTVMCLFALMNGDIVLEVWDHIRYFNPVVSALYLLLYCLFFICVVVNITISIIEEAYYASKRKLYTDWQWEETLGQNDPQFASLILKINKLQQQKSKKSPTPTKKLTPSPTPDPVAQPNLGSSQTNISVSSGFAFGLEPIPIADGSQSRDLSASQSEAKAASLRNMTLAENTPDSIRYMFVARNAIDNSSVTMEKQFSRQSRQLKPTKISGSTNISSSPPGSSISSNLRSMSSSPSAQQKDEFAP
ncbi:putative G-protein-coupled receptor family protein [Blattamonas nauphoetae]|uniref:G-protein-coupled receptor family protein n=1 Tax=Blattamonas nauphoetae TaxID=2049346 RepID=A0ABQ9YF89_9EUKA|nr:putative G-protein-coupled receptor family protein [Blattamonas nauphoetae]